MEIVATPSRPHRLTIGEEVTVPVVHRPGVGIAEDTVRLGDLLEDRLGRGPPRNFTSGE